MNRRDFLTVPLAAAAAGLVPTQKPRRKFATDTDIGAVALHHAINMAGFVMPPGRYRVVVHPEYATWAESAFMAFFYWDSTMHEPIRTVWDGRFELVLDPTLRDVGEWSLEGSEAIAWSAGA